MSYFKTCPHCGAHLDPGEKCDCQNEKAAQGVNTRDGAEGNKPTTCCPSSLTKNEEESQG